MNSISTKFINWCHDHARSTALMSVLTGVLLVLGVAQNRPLSRGTSRGETDVQLQLQEQMMTETQARTLENKLSTQTNATRITELENRLSFIQGSIMGFGALLTALQLLGLVRKRAGG